MLNMAENAMSEQDDHFDDMPRKLAEDLRGLFAREVTVPSEVERAIANLRAADALTPGAIAALSTPEVESLVRPAGFHRRKAATIRHLAEAAGATPDGWSELLSLSTDELRAALLSLPAPTAMNLESTITPST